MTSSSIEQIFLNLGLFLNYNAFLIKRNFQEEEDEEEEGEEDENPEPPSNRLDFDKLFRMCEDDEDMQDIMRSPIDIAIHNLE